MARTYNQWLASIQANETLNSLTGSAVAEWIAIRDFVIYIAMIFEGILEMLKSDIVTNNNTKQHGSITWWLDAAKQFQLGDSLVVVDGVRGYAVIDATKQIITNVAVNEVQTSAPNLYTILEIKGCKTVGGVKTQLTNTELTAWATFCKAIRPPGVPIQVISRVADVVKYAFTIKYDGNYSQSDINTAILAALTDFQNTLDFTKGIFYKSQLMAKIKDIPGVISATAIIDMSLNGGTLAVANLAEEQALPAGYFNYDAASTIAYTAI